MIAIPLPSDTLPAGAGLAAALAIGVAFGWCLERAGLGGARRLAAQFYGTDFTVLKVMLSAIATAALGVFWLSRLGVVEASRIHVPETYLLPQAVGGAVFGVGLVAAGLCPGTACVSAATGRRDGFAVVGGLFAGVLLFALAFPLLRGIHGSTAVGTMTFPALLHVSRAAATAAVVAMALGAFAGAEAWERRVSGGGA